MDYAKTIYTGTLYGNIDVTRQNGNTQIWGWKVCNSYFSFFFLKVTRKYGILLYLFFFHLQEQIAFLFKICLLKLLVY